MEFFDVVLIAVGNGDDRDLFDPVLFVEGEFGLGFCPEALFAFKRGGDDQFAVFGEVAVYPEGIEGYTVFDEGEGDHRIELGDEGLAGSEVLGKGEVKKDHLLAAFLVAVIDKENKLLLRECFDGFV